MNRFETGAYQANEQSDFNSDQETFKSLVESARNTDSIEEKEEKRRLAKELIVHGLVDRYLILDILRSQGADQTVLDEWEDKVLTTQEILDTLIPLSIDQTEEEPYIPVEPDVENPATETETKSKVEVQVIEVDDMILPTDDEPSLQSGEGSYEAPRLIPRTQMLMDMLDTYGIKPDQYAIVRGKNNDTVRKESYQMFLLPTIDKSVFVCDEEGNATFILHKIAQDLAEVKALYSLRKSELKTMGELVDQVNWTTPEQWEEEIFELLNKKVDGVEISDIGEYIENIKQQLSKQERRQFLSLEELKQEVAAAGVTSRDQYHEMRKNHPTWPSNPRDYYREEWIDWYDLWGKEKPRFVDLATLKQEVAAAGVTSKPQYFKERKNHPTWPSDPRDYYRKEWMGWGDLWVKEKPRFVDLATLKQEVAAAGVTTHDQYHEMRKEHPTWPSNPDERYKEWMGWGDLWVKEKP